MKKDGQQKTHAHLLVRLGEEALLFHDPGGECFANLRGDGRSRTWHLRSADFRNWVSARFCELEGKPPGAQALQDALTVLEGRAKFFSPQLLVFTRLAQHGEGIYLHLGDERWTVLEITSGGWRPVTSPPVFFLKPKGLGALPMPVEGGSVDQLRYFVNLRDDDDFILVASWLIASLRPSGPYPILVLQGEQGSAKSTLARMLRALVDPSTSPLRSPPRSERDLMIAAKNGWILSFDNISKLPAWLADAFCRLSTGGGLSTRELYSDGDEVFLDAMRPLILNGIEHFATRGDLIDRAIILNLPSIPPARRRLERDLWREFEAFRPRILGALLLAVAHALHNEDRFKRQSYPRMADLVHWSVAASTGLPWDEGQFIDAYERNRRDAKAVCLEADPVAGGVQALLTSRIAWEGTALTLLETLEHFVDETIVRRNSWPKTPNWLVNRLRRLAPSLRSEGIEIEFNDKVRPKTVAIRRIVSE